MIAIAATVLNALWQDATASERISTTSAFRTVVPQRRHRREIRATGSPDAMLALPTRLRVTLPLRVALVVFAAWALHFENTP